MINIRSETVLPIDEILPQINVHIGTRYRWAQLGVIAPDGRRVKLETIRIGGRIYSSEEAAERFIAELTGQEYRPKSLRRREADQAELALTKMGI